MTTSDSTTTTDRHDKIAALRGVLDDPRPWSDHVRGWTRDQFVTRMAELEAEMAPGDFPMTKPLPSYDDKPTPPYPFCYTPDKCAGKGYCRNDPSCNN